MIQFVYGKDKEIAAWVLQRISATDGDFGPGIKAIGMIDEHGRFLAGVVYHHWDPAAGTISMAAAAVHPRWLSRRVLQRVFDYPFAECGCQMLMIRLPADREQLLHQLAVGGFAFDKIRRLYGRDKAGIVATLTDDDWRACPFNKPAKQEFVEEAA